MNPALLVDAVPGTPAPTGLYSAATVLDLADPTRIDGGVRVIQLNCGRAAQWQPGCGPQDDPTATKDSGPRAVDAEFPTTIVYATDDCGLVASSEDEAVTRARQIMRLQEGIQVERHAAGQLLELAGTPATAPAGPVGLKLAVGAIEQALGETGMYGVIHAPRRFAALLSDFIVPAANGVLRTKLGNYWAFGTGYEELGENIVGTGPVTVRRGPISTYSTVEHRQNERTAVAEREVNTSWECVVVSQALPTA